MDIEQIERLVNLVAGSNVSEVTLRANGRRITVRKDPARSAAAVTTGAASLHDGAEGPWSATYDGENQTSIDAPPGPSETWITSPLVGIFHSATPPVEAGAKVVPDMVVGMIESMKLMN